MPCTWKEFLKDFPCLYDAKDPDFCDDAVKSRCMEKLLEKCNSEGGDMDMETLKQRVEGFRLANTWRSDVPSTSESNDQNTINTSRRTRWSQKACKDLESNCQEITAAITRSQNDRMLELTKEFPNLWNRRDLRFTDPILKTRSWEQLLVKYNAEASVPITMHRLKLRLHSLRRRLKCKQEYVKKIAQSITQKQEDQFLKLAVKYPCLWNPQDANYSNSEARACSQVKLLEAYNSLVDNNISMEDLERNLKKITLDLVYFEAAKSDRMLKMAWEFPCLWNSEDVDYNNPTAIAKAMELLLEKFNRSRKKAIDMEMLKKRIKNLRTRVSQYMNPEPASTTVPVVKKSQNDRLLELAEEFPCLWDRRDLNFYDPVINTRCCEQLLVKYNAEASVPITTDMLKKQLYNMNRRLKLRRQSAETLAQRFAQKREDLFRKLAVEYPCLWNPQDANYSNSEARACSQDKLLEAYNNSVVVNKISMEDLERNMKEISLDLVYLEASKSDRMLKMAWEFPCLWNSEDVDYKNPTANAKAMELLLENYNRSTKNAIDMEMLRRRIKNLRMRVFQYKNPQKPASTTVPVITTSQNDRMLEVAEEFPCLWDRRDLNFNNPTIKARSWEQLLVKYNAEASVPITIDKLKKEVYKMNRRLKVRRQSAEQNGDLLASTQIDQIVNLALIYPCLWDPEDSNYKNLTLKNRCWRNLQRKCQTEVNVIINARDLKRKINSLRPRIQAAAMLWREKEAGGSSLNLYDVETEASSDSDLLINLRQELPSQPVLQAIEIAFQWCCFCGEIRDDCQNITSDKSYVANNSTELKFNELSVLLNFSCDTTPQTVCQSCDTKLQDMYNFVNLAKKAQEKFTNVRNIDDLRENPLIENADPSSISTTNGSDCDNEKDIIFDSLSISDTEFIDKKGSSRKRKNEKEQAALSRKKCRIAIDLNSRSSSPFLDDSNASNDLDLNAHEELHSFPVTDEELINMIVSTDTTPSVPVGASKEAMRNVNKNGDIENEIQPVEITHNTDTPSSDVERQKSNETNSASEELMPVVEVAGFGIFKVVANIPKENIETFVVKKDCDQDHMTDGIVCREIQNTGTENSIKLPEEHGNDVLANVIASEFISNKDTETDIIAVIKNELPDVTNAADNIIISRKSATENIETLAIKEECIDLTDDIDLEPNTVTELQIPKVEPDVSGTVGTSVLQKVADELTGPTNVVNQSSNGEPVCVIPKSDLITLVESIVSRMLNK